MLSNAYFLAKFRFDTAENKPAKNLQNFAKFANFADPNPLTPHLNSPGPPPAMQPKRAGSPGPPPPGRRAHPLRPPPAARRWLPATPCRAVFHTSCRLSQIASTSNRKVEVQSISKVSYYKVCLRCKNTANVCHFYRILRCKVHSKGI